MLNVTFQGTNDSPVSSQDSDVLGFAVYVNALTDFILNCETPMTVAIQGDWGSGKTSLMNLIRDQIQNQDKVRTKCVWMNTWQFSQFDLGDDLPLNVIGLFTQTLDRGRKQEGSKVMRCLKRLAASRFVRTTATGAALFSTACVAGKDSANLLADMIGGQSNGFDSVEQIVEMRTGLESLVLSTLQDEGIDRIVLFVDDIDRLVPERAVELLEAMKVFLDVKGCVFVLACDYHVVSRGLIAKFGGDASDLKGKHFFDKIIQLPFSMPSGNLKVTGYLHKQLASCGVDLPDGKEDRLTIYEALLAHSVGFNPRSLKRLINSFRVLKHVAHQQRVFDVALGIGTKEDRERALFAVLCMQTAFEPVYQALIQVSRQRGADFGELINELAEFSGDPAEDENMVSSRRVRIAMEEVERGRTGTAREIGPFFTALSRALRTSGDSQKDLRAEEIAILLGFLRLAAITATAPSAPESTPVVQLDAVRHAMEEAKETLKQTTFGECTRRIEYYDDEQGIWCSPRIPHLGFGIYFGVSSDGTLSITVDLHTEKKARTARANAKEWCQDALRETNPTLAPIVKSRGNARYGVVNVALEPSSFASMDHQESHHLLMSHLGQVFIPMVRKVVERFEAQRNRYAE